MQPRTLNLHDNRCLYKSTLYILRRSMYQLFTSPCITQVCFCETCSIRPISHLADGSPVSLDDILQTSIFKLKCPSGSETTSFALTLPSASFPLLSQGDHPTLGTPCWYFHPCETDRAVNEFMAEVEQADWSGEMRLARWLELWLMVVGSVLNL